MRLIKMTSKSHNAVAREPRGQQKHDQRNRWRPRGRGSDTNTLEQIPGYIEALEGDVLDAQDELRHKDIGDGV